MTFRARIECDVAGCCNEIELDASHPADAEIELEDESNNWLFVDNKGSHYCPVHALEAANELNLEYAKN
ncbi:MAG: hypothetical protein ACI9T7_000180 [Oleiphilaceae bacterium]|jgi:hypothetical protein